MRGAVVREKLHGRTAQGTWVQLEKTPAAFGPRKLPSLDDIRHLIDYVVYRVTRSNVGPWGLPGGRRADPDRAADPDSLLASAERSALVTITRYTTQGSAETAGANTDLILARHDGRLHVLTRDPADRTRLIPGPAGDEDIRDMLAELLT
jgi:hypothetical protein